ncbi:MAG: 3-oxoacyl-ACP reductase FabG [bacterium]|nr:3-oxoacyl-ACP reductase FabG [bacterium]
MERTALVTGASRGLGAAVARALAAAGARVAVNYRARRDSAERVADDIRRTGGEAVCLGADVAGAGEAEAMVAEVVSRWGRLDILVNNAGIFREALLARLSEEDWDAVIAVNLTGAFNCARAAARSMVPRRSGHIINISSILGVRGARGGAAYAAAKAGLIGLTKSLARELGPSGIMVNAVIPGFLPTGMTGSVGEAEREEIRRESVLGRLGDAEAAARFIAHLAGMRTVSGQLFNLDGRIFRWA